jgi:hypothetical protein
VVVHADVELVQPVHWYDVGLPVQETNSVTGIPTYSSLGPGNSVHAGAASPSCDVTVTLAGSDVPDMLVAVTVYVNGVIGGPRDRDARVVAVALRHA